MAKFNLSVTGMVEDILSETSVRHLVGQDTCGLVFNSVMHDLLIKAFI